MVIVMILKSTPEGVAIVPPLHPCCPGCGHIFNDWELMPDPDEIVYVNMQVIDGEPMFCVLTKLECECGRVMDMTPASMRQRGDGEVT
jgi:hypothetical protein